MSREGRRRPNEGTQAVGSRARVAAAVSAGGVVFGQRGGQDQAEVVLVGQSNINRWGLPKGAPAAGESLPEAALREVREETGIDAEIVDSLGHIEYWFAARGVRYHKVVHFYLMRAVGGDTGHHDAEHDLVAWFPIASALDIMSFANEKEVVRRAADMLVGLEAKADQASSDQLLRDCP